MELFLLGDVHVERWILLQDGSKFNFLRCGKIVVVWATKFVWLSKVATEIPLKIMKDAFYFNLKAVLVFKILKFLF